MSEWKTTILPQHIPAPTSFAKPKRFTPAIDGRRYVLEQKEFLASGDGQYEILHKIAANVVELEDMVAVEAALNWAKAQDCNELLVLDENDVRRAMMREVPNRLYFDDESVYRCGSCGVHVHAGDNYCACCGQKLREVEHE